MSHKLSTPLQRQALEEAANFHIRLCSGNPSEADEQALQQWLKRDKINAWAWDRVDQLQKQLATLPKDLSVNTLERTEQNFNSRRTVLKGFALMVGLGVIGLPLYRKGLFEPLLADHYTATGEVSELTLEDGSILTLNTSSSIDLFFNNTERKIVLRQGEIMIKTAKDNLSSISAGHSRPFIIETANGKIRALGTRFSVRYFNDSLVSSTKVNVYEHSVEITTQQGTQSILTVGKTALFNINRINPTTNHIDNDAWTRDMLVVNNMRLDDFIIELSRYRLGLIHCESNVAHYRITGVFKISDTDQALRAIEKSFPVTVNYRSRTWVSISASY